MSGKRENRRRVCGSLPQRSRITFLNSKNAEMTRALDGLGAGILPKDSSVGPDRVLNVGVTHGGNRAGGAQGAARRQRGTLQAA